MITQLTFNQSHALTIASEITNSLIISGNFPTVTDSEIAPKFIADFIKNLATELSQSSDE